MLQHTDHSVIARPNRSATWRTNQRFLIFMTCVIGCIAISFSLMGAWVILPFAGIELLALGSALYWVSWKLSYCHALRLVDQQLVIEKGVYYPRQQWQWPLHDARIRVVRNANRGQAPEVFIQYKNEAVQIGEFLGADESERLIRALRTIGLHVVSDSTHGSLQL